MVNHDQLLHLVARAERGALLPGEADLLRDALNLLDDMATTLDKLMGRHPGDYQVDDTASMRIVTTPNSTDPWGGPAWQPSGVDWDKSTQGPPK